MKERPIIFSAPMVRAILSGTKTQTRRIAKVPAGMSLTGYARDYGHGAWTWHLAALSPPDEWVTLNCPFGSANDRPWVRETFARQARFAGAPERDFIYRADGEQPEPALLDENLNPILTKGGKLASSWISAIRMPRRASRIVLEVIGVRVERVQHINENDAIAEGVERTVIGDAWRRYADEETEAVGLPPCTSARDSYRSLWERINGDGSWGENPWVWVIEFRGAA